MSGIDQYTKLLIRAEDGSFVDKSSSNRTITSHGAVYVNNSGVFNDEGICFPEKPLYDVITYTRNILIGSGANDATAYLSLDYFADFEFPKSGEDFTLDYWYKPFDKTMPTQIIGQNSSNSYFGLNHFYHEVFTHTEIPRLDDKRMNPQNIAVPNSTSSGIYPTIEIINNNKWTHYILAGDWKEEENAHYIHFFYDGYYVGSGDENISREKTISSSGIEIGRHKGYWDANNQYTFPMYGQIDEIRFSKGINRLKDSNDPLYIDEIGNYYPYNTQLIVPPTGRYTLVPATGTMGLFTYGIGNEAKYKKYADCSAIITDATFYTIYDGQYTEIGGGKIYGTASSGVGESGTLYEINFYADTDRKYAINEYETYESSGTFTFIGEKYGVGISGVVDYNWGKTGGNDNNTVLLINFEGASGDTTFYDTSVGGETHIITSHNGAKISSATYKFGSTAGYFDGSSNYISTPNSTDFDLSSGDFTIDGWFYTNEHKGTILNKDGLFGSSLPQYSISITSEGHIFFDLGDGDGTSEYETYEGTSVINTMTWNHFLASVENEYVYLFLNGQIEASGAKGTMYAGDKNLLIGYHQGQPSSSYFDGYIDEIRVSKGVARHTENFIPPKYPYT